MTRSLLARPAVGLVTTASLLLGAPLASANGEEPPEEPKQDRTVLERVEALEQENKELKAGRAEDQARIEQLEGQVDVLGDEFEQISFRDIVPVIGDSYYGLGLGASKVYSLDQPGISIGGYGEMLYENFNGSTTDEIDFLRAVVYVGYKFNDDWVFNSEIEFEHASTDKGGSASVEFATLDRLINDAINARAGLLLNPMGFVNELHEPTAYLTATRSITETRIIPSTWRENGAGVYGEAGGVSYRAYVMNGLDAMGFTAQGLRGGRQKGSQALADDFALVVRGDWVGTPGLIVGGSVYMGDSGQGQMGLGATGTSIYEVHAEYRAGGVWARALAAMAELDDVAQLNAALGNTGAQSVGEELEGAYVEVGYDLLSLFDADSESSLSPYVRFETFDTQAAVPAGFSSDPLNDDEILTLGVNYQPISQIAIKLDYQDWDRGTDRWSLQLGYVF